MDVARTAAEKLIKKLESAPKTSDSFGQREAKEDSDSILCELIRLGGRHAERLLSKAIDVQASRRRIAKAKLERTNDEKAWAKQSLVVDFLSDNLEMLTALRRIQ